MKRTVLKLRAGVVEDLLILRDAQSVLKFRFEEGDTVIVVHIEVERYNVNVRK
jgi:hypothetical protein